MSSVKMSSVKLSSVKMASVKCLVLKSLVIGCCVLRCLAPICVVLTFNRAFELVRGPKWKPESLLLLNSKFEVQDPIL